MSNLLQYGMPLKDLHFDPKCTACIRGVKRLLPDSQLKPEEKTIAIPGCIQNGDLSNLKLIVISDYPSTYENREGYNFYDNEPDRLEKKKQKKKLEVGWPNAGNYIRRKLESLGLDTYKEVYFTNVIKCKAISDSTIIPNESKELSKCVKKWLILELDILDRVAPFTPILIAGKYAYVAFKKYIPNSPFPSELTLKHARRKEYRYKQHPVFVTVNPARAALSISKLESLEVETKSDLKNVIELPTIVGSPDWLYTKDLQLLKECLTQLP